MPGCSSVKLFTLGLNLWSHFTVPPQGPTLGSYLRILGSRSYIRLLCPIFPVCPTGQSFFRTTVYVLFFFLSVISDSLHIRPIKTWHVVTTKRKMQRGQMCRKTDKKSQNMKNIYIYSIVKTIYIMRQRKTFCRHRILGCSDRRTKIVNTDILVTLEAKSSWLATNQRTEYVQEKDIISRNNILQVISSRGSLMYSR